MEPARLEWSREWLKTTKPLYINGAWTDAATGQVSQSINPATGQVLGTSTAKGEEPHTRPVHFNEILATIYRQLGVPTDRTFRDTAGRPVAILDHGQPIPELI